MFNTKKLPNFKKNISVETPKSINVAKPPVLEKTQVETLNGMNPELVKAYAFLNSKTVPKEQRDRFVKILKARIGLLDFITFTKPDYEVNWHHQLLCDEIDDFLEDPNVNRLMIFIGPRRGKSEIVSRRLPAYVFGKNPDIKIIATSYGAELASSMNRDVQRIIDSEVYREVFPNTCLSGRNVKTSAKGSYVRTSDKFQIVGHQGEYRSAGVAGAITGAGADLAIIDDPLKDWKEALSNTVKQGVYDWYTSTLSTRLSPNGKVIILLTRWAEDDLAGRLLDDMKKNDKADKWKVISLPEQFDSDNEHTHPLDQREDGEFIWPDRFTPESMETRKASVGSKVWAALYQQQPSPGDGTIFKASWFQYYRELPQFTRVTISVDCAFSDTEKSDFVCITVWGVQGANKYLLHLVNERLDFPATCREIANTKAMFPHANRIIVENKANGPAVISTLKSKISGIIPYNPTESKVARATAVSPQFEAGNVFLPEALYEKNRVERPWCNTTLNTFIAQFKAFPWGRHDDMVDSAVQFLINEANVPQWLKSVENLEKNPKSAEQTATEELARVMGWGNIKKESQEVKYYNNHNR